MRHRVGEDLDHLARMRFEVDRNQHALGGPPRRTARRAQAGSRRRPLSGSGGVLPPAASRPAVTLCPQLVPGVQTTLAQVHRAAVAEAGGGLVQRGEQVLGRPTAREGELGGTSSSSAAVDDDGLAVDETAARRTEERDGGGDVLHGAEAGYGVISVLILRNRSSSRRCSTIGVTVTPGATALHRMPCGPYWRRRCAGSARSGRPWPWVGATAPPADHGERRGDVDDGRAGSHVRG